MKWSAVCIWYSIVLITIVDVLTQNTHFVERYSWKTLDFQFPDESSDEAALNSRDYVPINNVPVGIEIWRDRFFVTVPRWQPGIGSTLNYFKISNSDNSGSTTANTSNSPVLIPYPTFEANHITADLTSYENKIVSVFRLKVDSCDRLWFADTGVIDILGAYNQVSPPRLFVFDLRTDRQIRQYTFPAPVLTPATTFGGNIVVDVTSDTCSRAYAYLPDYAGNGLVVYSYDENRSWRIQHPFFYFDPFASPFHVADLVFLWTDGIFGASLSAMQSDGYRTLYFTALASNNLFSVSTRNLIDSGIASNTTVLLNAYRHLGTRGQNMQTTAHMMDERSGTLFYTLPNRNGIGCWNSVRYSTQYTPRTNAILAADNVTMIFPNDIVLDDADNVWMLSDRLPISNMRGLDENEINFRLFSARISDVVRNTVCDPVQGSSTSASNSNDGHNSESLSSNKNNHSFTNRFNNKGNSETGTKDNVVFPHTTKYATLNQVLRS